MGLKAVLIDDETVTSEYFIGWLCNHMEAASFPLDLQDVPRLQNDLQRRGKSTIREALQDPKTTIRLQPPLWVNRVATYIDGLWDYQAVLEGTLEIEGQPVMKRDMVHLRVTHLGHHRLEVKVRWSYETLAGYVDALVEDIRKGWPAKAISEDYPEVKPSITGAVKGELEKRPMPKYRRRFIADYAQSLPKAYWDLFNRDGQRPTSSVLAEHFGVDEKTIDRCIKDIRREGGTWPPPPPKAV